MRHFDAVEFWVGTSCRRGPESELYEEKPEPLPYEHANCSKPLHVALPAKKKPELRFVRPRVLC